MICYSIELPFTNQGFTSNFGTALAKCDSEVY